MSNATKYVRDSQDTSIEELRQYKLLVDSVRDYAIFLLDDKGYIRTWNKGAKKNKGYTAKEIIGKHFSIFYMEEDVHSGWTDVFRKM